MKIFQVQTTFTQNCRPPEHRCCLSDYDFEPHYFQLKTHGSIRMHYLDEGPRDANETILLVHGEPCWSFIYRKMIPIFTAAGFRVIAPDLVGFGKSDKPTKRTDHSIERHVDWFSELLLGLDLDNITAYIHDWGSKLMITVIITPMFTLTLTTVLAVTLTLNQGGFPGIRTIARYPERFLRVVLSITGLPEGNGAAPMFKMWSGGLSQKLPKWGPFIQMNTTQVLSAEEIAAYDAPFPKEVPNSTQI